MNTLISKQDLFDHFANRLTPLQRSRLEEWLQQPQHLDLYYEWLEEWEHQNLQYVTNTDLALQHSLQQVDHWEQTKLQPTVQPLTLQKNTAWMRWTAIAASIVLCSIAGLFATRSIWSFKTIETAFGEVRQVTLPDGSLVTLNTHSVLKFPRFGFGNHTREVELAGEATFSVKHTDDKQRFIVHTAKAIDVVVLGTEFNVYARPRGTQVILNRGKIQLSYVAKHQQRKQLLMRPGDFASLDKHGKLSIRHNTQPALLMAWKDHQFIFSRTSMADIVALVKENYNLTVKLKNDRLAERTVSGNFQAKDADEFLQVITQLLEVKYNRRGSTIIFFE